MRFRILCLLLLMPLVYNVHAQAIDWLIKTDNGPIMTSCYDSTNEQVYIGGHTKDSLVINDSLVFPEAGHMDGFTSVFDKNGSHKWTKIWPNLRVMHVEADRQGDVFVTGTFDGYTTIGDTTYTAKGAADGCIMKLSAEGEIKWFVAFGNLASTMLGNEHVEVMNITNNSNCLLYCHFPQGSYTYYDEEEIRVRGDVILSVDSAGQLNYFKKMPDLNNPNFQNYNKDSTRLTANFSGDLTIDSISISAINYKKSAFTSFFRPVHW